MTSPAPVGIVLAAGAGRRMGTPKALVRDEDGPWLLQAARLLTAAGCRPVIVVLGAAAADAIDLLDPLRGDGADPSGLSVVVAADWASGVSSSLRAGLIAARSTEAQCALITLVDLPGLPLAAARRVMSERGRDVMRQATYGGRPGHPVLIGRDHWGPLEATVTGDDGARAYLAAHGVVEVECGDLGDGLDRDDPS